MFTQSSKYNKFCGKPREFKCTQRFFFMNFRVFTDDFHLPIRFFFFFMFHEVMRTTRGLEETRVFFNYAKWPTKRTRQELLRVDVVPESLKFILAAILHSFSSPMKNDPCSDYKPALYQHSGSWLHASGDSPVVSYSGSKYCSGYHPFLHSCLY